MSRDPLEGAIVAHYVQATLPEKLANNFAAPNHAPSGSGGGRFQPTMHLGHLLGSG